MKKILFTLAVSLITVKGIGQTITVVDKSTLQPLPGVSISGKNHEVLGNTDAKGHAILNSKTPDSLWFRSIGYRPEAYSMKQLEAMSYKVFLSETRYSLDEIVISSTRFDEKRSDIPQQVQLLDSRDIDFINAQTSADLMQATGNVLVQKSQAGGGSPIIRGFEANKILIVVDGVRMNNAIFRGGHLQNIITMDNSILEKTEILFGPGSVVYGSDALGGVINFTTRKPLLSDSGKLLKTNAFTRYATANTEKTGHLDVNLGFKKIGFLSSFTWSDFDDLRQGNIRNDFYGDWGKRRHYAERINGRDSMVRNVNVNIQRQSGYSQYGILQKILFRQNEKISHMLNFQFTNSSDIPRYDRLTETDSKGVLRNAQWYYGPQKRMLLTYTLDLNGNNIMYTRSRITAGYQDVGESRHNRSFGKTSLNHRLENVKVYTLNADFSRNIRKHEIRYGAEIAHNTVRSTANAENITTGSISPLDTRYPDGGSTFRTIAGYITHTLELSPKWVISDGIRYSSVKLHSEFNDTTFFPFPFKEVTQNSGALNASLGVVFMPGPDWRFNALAASGFRAPNVDDLSKVFESVPGRIIVPNPNLKPENTLTGELGISRLIRDIVRVEATGFYTSYRNVITVDRTTFSGQDSILFEGKMSGVISNVNKSKAYIYGVSGNITADITRSFSISSSLNYTFGRILTDTTEYPLDHIPPVFGLTSFNLQLKKFRGEFYVMYNGWKRLKDYNLVGEDNIQYATPLGMPAWNTLNLRGSYQLNGHLQMQAALENITDQNYRVFASGIGAPGRNLILTLRGRF